MKKHPSGFRAGFTLIEILVATAISVIIVLGVVQIATYSMKAYDNMMGLVSTTAVSRQVLDALESDLQSAVIKSDGNTWLQCYTDSPDPSASSNFDVGSCKAMVLFSTPTDRDQFKPGATGASRIAYKGDLCAVRYRLMNATPLPTGLSSPDKAYTFNRVIVNPEDTFNSVLPLATSANSTQTLPQILNGITVDSGTPSARNIAQNQPADIFGMNVVGLTPVFIFQYVNNATTPATTTYFYAAPDSPLNRQIYNAQNFSAGFGGPTGAGFNPVFFTDLKISGGKYAVNTGGKPALTDAAWKEGTLTAVIFSLTVVDDSGADEIRAIQSRGTGQLQPADWQRIMQQHSRIFTRRVNTPGSN